MDDPFMAEVIAFVAADDFQVGLQSILCAYITIPIIV